MLDRQRKWNVRVATACFILQNMRSEFHEAGGRRNRIAEEGEEHTTTNTLTNQQTFIAQSDSIQQVPSNHSPENSEVKVANGMFLFRCSNSKTSNDSFLITSQQNNKQQRSKKL